MKFLLFLLFLGSLSADVVFQKTLPEEIPPLQDRMLNYYSEQLVNAGLFANVAVARELAKIEWDGERQDPSKDFYYFDLMDQGSRCGYLMYWTEKQLAYLDAIYLEEAFRGRGLGMESIQEFEKRVQESGIEKIRLYVFAHNKPAFKLYRKLGYEIEETYYQDDRLLGYHLIKNLPSSNGRSHVDAGGL